eukprot:SAG31_NODE_2597_length_5420_cov_16.255403_1_plen_127_part_00
MGDRPRGKRSRGKKRSNRREKRQQVGERGKEFCYLYCYQSRQVRFKFTSKYNENLMKNDLLRKVATSPLGEVGVLLFRNKPLGWIRKEDFQEIFENGTIASEMGLHAIDDYVKIYNQVLTRFNRPN